MKYLKLFVIMILIIVWPIHSLISYCKITVKRKYLQSIGFKRVLWRQSMFGNFDTYKWERNETSIKEIDLENTTLKLLKETYK